MPKVESDVAVVVLYGSTGVCGVAAIPRVERKVKPALTDGERTSLRVAIELEGLERVARRCGCSRDSLARAVAGIGCRAGTISLIRRAMFERVV